MLLLLGGLLLLAVVFNLIEKVVPRNTSAATTAVPGEEPAPIRPELSREDERTVLIDAGFFHHSRFRYHGDDATEQAEITWPSPRPNDLPCSDPQTAC